ncbi:MAG: hypothetical protein UT11_C0015G0012 [Berkelbacteria bacterium GW2011_GWA2_38_9]|uniref:Uncharacterized protein n=1 Tax=Berkelbacteria bacterium GW2011_GWA2_38_9 TaxID=1618334 RepID=A0A0G0LPU5_9BACT|nr:MAG: hypothetical protein UT11_C0015G0012 [Berkelbacteria bacterium GW2011_GWA2_38_9]
MRSVSMFLVICLITVSCCAGCGGSSESSEPKPDFVVTTNQMPGKFSVERVKSATRENPIRMIVPGKNGGTEEILMFAEKGTGIFPNLRIWSPKSPEKEQNVVTAAGLTGIVAKAFDKSGAQTKVDGQLVESSAKWTELATTKGRSVEEKFSNIWGTLIWGALGVILVGGALGVVIAVTTFVIGAIVKLAVAVLIVAAAVWAYEKIAGMYHTFVPGGSSITPSIVQSWAQNAWRNAKLAIDNLLAELDRQGVRTPVFGKR